MHVAAADALVLPQGWYWRGRVLSCFCWAEHQRPSGKLMLIALASASLVMFDVLRVLVDALLDPRL